MTGPAGGWAVASLRNLFSMIIVISGRIWPKSCRCGNAARRPSGSVAERRPVCGPDAAAGSREDRLLPRASPGVLAVPGDEHADPGLLDPVQPAQLFLMRGRQAHPGIHQAQARRRLTARCCPSWPCRPSKAPTQRLAVEALLGQFQGIVGERAAGNPAGTGSRCAASRRSNHGPGPAAASRCRAPARRSEAGRPAVRRALAGPKALGSDSKSARVMPGHVAHRQMATLSSPIAMIRSASLCTARW